jgi:aminoglycoside phosphotransferase (APT) family kinase protein
MTDVGRLVAAAFSRSPQDLAVTLRPPLEHQSNRLYDVWADGRHCIAKEYLQEGELREAPAREFGALRLLSELDIAPQPVFYDPALGPVVIYVYLDGVMWDRRRPSAAQLSQLATVWNQMHAATTDGLWPSRNYRRSFDAVEAQLGAVFAQYERWCAAAYPAGQAIARECCALLAARRSAASALLAADVVPCFCRADARFANVIERPDGRLGLIDWEDSGLRDPARDVVDLLTHPNQEDLLSDEEWQAFLQPYLAVRRAVDPRIDERIHLYGAIYSVFWLAMVLRQGMRAAEDGALTTWSVNGLPGEWRLQRYLGRALAWPDGGARASHRALGELAFFPSDITPRG